MSISITVLSFYEHTRARTILYFADSICITMPESGTIQITILLLNKNMKMFLEVTPFVDEFTHV